MPTSIRVFVYYNLHKHVFSIKALNGEDKGRVIAHAKHIWLSDIEFKVSEKGRQKVLLKRQKNVHAGVKGILLRYETDGEANMNLKDYREVTYDPYKYTSFVHRDDKSPIHHAKSVFMTGKKVFYLL